MSCSLSLRCLEIASKLTLKGWQLGCCQPLRVCNWCWMGVDKEGLSNSSTKTFKSLILKSEFTSLWTFKAKWLSHCSSTVVYNISFCSIKSKCKILLHLCLEVASKLAKFSQLALVLDYCWEFRMLRSILLLDHSVQCALWTVRERNTLNLQTENLTRLWIYELPGYTLGAEGIYTLCFLCFYSIFVMDSST
jgi:hypothetical protein